MIRITADESISHSWGSDGLCLADMQPLHDGRLCSTDMYFVGGSSQPTYNPPPWEALHAESAHPKAAQHFFLSTRSSRPKRPILAPVLLAPISGLVPGLIRPTEVPRWGLLGVAAAEINQHFDKRIARDSGVMLGIFPWGLDRTRLASLASHLFGIPRRGFSKGLGSDKFGGCGCELCLCTDCMVKVVATNEKWRRKFDQCSHRAVQRRSAWSTRRGILASRGKLMRRVHHSLTHAKVTQPEAARPKAARASKRKNSETEASNCSSSSGFNSGSSSRANSTNRSPPLGMAAAKVDQHFDKRIARYPGVMVGIFRRGFDRTLQASLPSHLFEILWQGFGGILGGLSVGMEESMEDSHRASIVALGY